MPRRRYTVAAGSPAGAPVRRRWVTAALTVAATFAAAATLGVAVQAPSPLHAADGWRSTAPLAASGQSGPIVQSWITVAATPTGNTAKSQPVEPVSIGSEQAPLPLVFRVAQPSWLLVTPPEPRDRVVVAENTDTVADGVNHGAPEERGPPSA